MTQVSHSIVVAVDLSEASTHALRAAFQLARASGGPLHVVFVVDGYDPMQQMQRAHAAHKLDTSKELGAVDTLIGQVGASVSGASEVQAVPHILVGPVARCVTDFAAKVQAQLLVVGHGRRGVRQRVLGSVAEHVLRHAPCPVLVMRPKSWT